MKRPVVAIAIDGLGPAMLEARLASGAMPRLAALRAQGAWARMRTPQETPYESVWQVFLEGGARRSGTGGSPGPFYARAGGRTAIVDVPLAPLVAGLEGMQLLGWGMEQNESTARCSPPELLSEVLRRHGPHPVFGGDAAYPVARRDGRGATSYRLPSVYDAPALADLEKRIRDALGRRAAILCEILASGPWDLVLATFAEWHVAAHLLWHLGEPHPLAGRVRWQGEEPLAAVARALDESVGAIVCAVPQDAFLAIFSLSGMSANHADLCNFLFLPEFLYRLHRGAPALAPGDASRAPPAPAAHYRRHWKDEVWALRTELGERELESPGAQERRGDAWDWCPLNWYRPLWPQMPAYAVAGFSHGLVRLNGGAPARARARDGLARALRRLVNARTGRPMVRDIVVGEDLVVQWDEREVTDVVESPDVGRIGPVPYLRTGGHAPDGFCIARGPGIAPGGRLPEGTSCEALAGTLAAGGQRAKR
jgi:hypothetical protein